MLNQTDSVNSTDRSYSTTEVQRLTEGTRTALAAHFLTLSAEDRRLRFGASTSAERIEAYVAGIDFGHDAVFGVFDDELALVGVAHVAFMDDAAELGISVLPEHRGRGAGRALFARASEHARNRFVPRLFMHCLSENAAMMHIARASGMDIVAEAGDADAHLALSPASPASVTGEYLTDRFALFDYALKAHVATLKGINSALAGA
ncbi:MAG TPA: GNAT family N-acetyltransferase [Casimicrobiaceae bacterium]|nr:GNAT family N-acetyltransferase [Casimicrobiaceae bacterium]